jgi:hypothetical protein
MRPGCAATSRPLPVMKEEGATIGPRNATILAVQHSANCAAATGAGAFAIDSKRHPGREARRQSGRGLRQKSLARSQHMGRGSRTAPENRAVIRNNNRAPWSTLTIGPRRDRGRDP